MVAPDVPLRLSRVGRLPVMVTVCPEMPMKLSPLSLVVRLSVEAWL